MLRRALRDKVVCAKVRRVKTKKRQAQKAGLFDSETIAPKDTIFGLETE
jgi:hypothetical protein